MVTSWQQVQPQSIHLASLYTATMRQFGRCALPGKNNVVGLFACCHPGHFPVWSNLQWTSRIGFVLCLLAQHFVARQRLCEVIGGEHPNIAAHRWLTSWQKHTSAHYTNCLLTILCRLCGLSASLICRSHDRIICRELLYVSILAQSVSLLGHVLSFDGIVTSTRANQAGVLLIIATLSCASNELAFKTVAIAISREGMAMMQFARHALF